MAPRLAKNWRDLLSCEELLVWIGDQAIRDIDAALLVELDLSGNLVGAHGIESGARSSWAMRGDRLSSSENVPCW